MSDPASSAPVSPSDTGAGWRLFGVLLVISGVLLTAFSSLCTTAILMDPHAGPEMGDLTGAAIVVGGPFILFGLFLWWGGVRAFKKGKRAQAAVQSGPASPLDTRPPEPPVTA